MTIREEVVRALVSKRDDSEAIKLRALLRLEPTPRELREVMRRIDAMRRIESKT